MAANVKADADAADSYRFDRAGHALEIRRFGINAFDDGACILAELDKLPL